MRLLAGAPPQLLELRDGHDAARAAAVQREHAHALLLGEARPRREAVEPQGGVEHAAQGPRVAGQRPRPRQIRPLLQRLLGLDDELRRARRHVLGAPGVPVPQRLRLRLEDGAVALPGVGAAAGRAARGARLRLGCAVGEVWASGPGLQTRDVPQAVGAVPERVGGAVPERARIPALLPGGGVRRRRRRRCSWRDVFQRLVHALAPGRVGVGVVARGLRLGADG
mmetsp:Transcript_16283/g.49781  ORF Transcript_16283/g.49781 Transcript_16283/m.49781 type:complete len:224 (+) Transcript_16283:1136-1807(+)